jgi:allantoinase
MDASCETCPHYLLLTDEDIGRLGAVAKCAPPLRATEEQQDLWARLGDVTTIGSDHSPSPWEMKERSNFFDVWGGISGCHHLLPLLLDAVREKKAFSHSEIAKWTSAAVAKRFGISQKGGVEVGKDADFTLVDLRAEETITTESLLYRHRHSPYVGRRPSAKVVRTILRGQTIFQNGKIAARPMGRFLRPNEYV